MTHPRLAAWDVSIGDALWGAPRDRSDDAGPPRSRRHRGEDQDSRHLAADTASEARTIDGVPVAVLLERLKGDDESALSTLYLAYYDRLWRLGVVLTGASDIADEMVQDAFFTIWRRRAELGPEMDLQAYLYTAIRNAARMRGRHARVVRNMTSAVEQDRLALPAHGAAPERPDTNAEVREFQVAYTRALELLSERERIAIRLRLEDDATFEEIGGAIGLSKVGARTVVLRAEGKIRGLLAEHRS